MKYDHIYSHFPCNSCHNSPTVSSSQSHVFFITSKSSSSLCLYVLYVHGYSGYVYICYYQVIVIKSFQLVLSLLPLYNIVLIWYETCQSTNCKWSSIKVSVSTLLIVREAEYLPAFLEFSQREGYQISYFLLMWCSSWTSGTGSSQLKSFPLSSSILQLDSFYAWEKGSELLLRFMDL